MVWDVALRPPKVSECIHYLPLSREQMCVISPVILSRIPLQEFFFLKWSLAFLYYLFFEMHPLSLALIFHSFCLRFFFIHVPFIPLVQLSSKYNSAFLHYLLFFVKQPSHYAIIFHFFVSSSFFFFKRSESYLLSLKF